MTEEKSPIYPNIAQSFGIAGFVFLMMLGFSPIVFFGAPFMGEELAFMIYYIVSMGVAFMIANSMKKSNLGNQPFDFKPGNTGIIIAVIITMAGIQMGIISPLVSLIPFPDSMRDLFMHMSSQTGIYSFITIVIAAPILEELIFRGVMLDGLLKRYNPVKAIIISSFLFGLIHLNPWQFIGAMIIGIFAGWVYYKTQKLSYPIIIHMANNGLAFLSMSLSESSEQMEESLVESYGNMSTLILVTAIAIIIAGVGIYFLRKNIKLERNVELEPVSVDQVSES